VLFQFNYHTTPDDVDFGITQLDFVMYDLDGETHAVDANGAVKAQYFHAVIDAVAKINACKF
jgi:hypothetical protein